MKKSEGRFSFTQKKRCKWMVSPFDNEEIGLELLLLLLT
jgi:hypothetical protein